MDFESDQKSREHSHDDQANEVGEKRININEEAHGLPSEKDSEQGISNRGSTTASNHEYNDGDNPIVYPGTGKLILLLGASSLSIFLVALDTTIVSTAIPRITDDFHSLDDVAWYGSGFFMTMAAFQSMAGKAYKYFSIKIVFLLCIFVFEIGSLICALAPTSTALIVGRAIAGLGAAGVSSGCYIIIGISARPARVPALLGLIGASFAVASVVGPLLGGVFTENLTWRWCFWINLPIGGLAFLIITIFFNTPAHAKPVPASWQEKVKQMDIPGTVILLGAVISFILGLQWGGVTKAWSSGAVIGTLVIAGVLTIVFVLTQYFAGERAAMNPRILRDKSMLYLMVYQAILSGCFFVLLYYMPIYFQTVSGVDAANSGVRTIPMVATSSVFAIVSGFLISFTGEFQGVMIFGTTVITIGCGLIYTLDVGTASGKWIGYQLLTGFGLGLNMQIAVTAAQSLADPADISVASAMALFFQMMGGTIWLAVGQSLFSNRLMKALTESPNINPAEIVAAGATGLRSLLSGQELLEAVESYMAGLKDGYALCIALAGAAFVVAVAMTVFDRKKLSKGAAPAAA